MREIGVLRALGFSMPKMRDAVPAGRRGAGGGGSAASGWARALAYGELIMYGLRTWWVGRGGHAPARAARLRSRRWPAARRRESSTGLAAIAWTLRSLQPVTPRGLLAGEQNAAIAAPAVWLPARCLRRAAACWRPAWPRALDQTAAILRRRHAAADRGALLRIGLAAMRRAVEQCRRTQITLGLRSASLSARAAAFCASR